MGEVVYLFLDARYEKVHVGGHAVDMAVLIAQAIKPNGKRHLLGVMMGQGEAEMYWHAFLQSLLQRGLYSVRIITSDSHTGLRQGRKAVFGGIPWQHC